MKKQKMVPEIFVIYDYQEFGGEICEDEEGCAYPCREPSHYEFQTIGFQKEKPKTNTCFYESFEVPFDFLDYDTLFLVVFRFQTGDSYGITDGSFHLAGLARTHKEAELLGEKIFNDPKEYKPWEGYFERFEEIEIYELQFLG